jgi:hypothetical protein
MISPNVHMPRNAPIPRCKTIAPTSTIGRHQRTQINAENDSSQMIVTCVITLTIHG